MRTEHLLLVVLIVGSVVACIGSAIAIVTIMVEAAKSILPIDSRGIQPERVWEALRGVEVYKAAAPLALAAVGHLALLVSMMALLDVSRLSNAGWRIEPLRVSRLLHIASLYVQAIGYLAAMASAANSNGPGVLVALATVAVGWIAWLVAAIILLASMVRLATIAYTILVVFANPVTLGVGYIPAAIALAKAVKPVWASGRSVIPSTHHPQ